MNSPSSDVLQWVPDTAILNDIVHILQQADSCDSEVQRRLAEAVVRLEALIDAPCYFCFILVDGNKEVQEVRQRAGLLLKNRISALVKKASQRPTLDGRTKTGITADERAVMDYVKKNALRAICDRHHIIRETAGTVLAAIVGCQGVQQFPEVLPSLFQLLSHPELDIVGGAFSALSKIIEDELDRNEMLSSSITGTITTTTGNDTTAFPQFCIHKLLPKLLQLATPQTSLLQRRQALICLNHFERANLFGRGEVFEEFFDHYWNCLGVLALDPSPEIRLSVLQGMCQIGLMTPDVLIEKLTSLIPFVGECLSTSQPYEVRFECLELLFDLISQSASHPLIEEALPQLLPLLVENAKYSNWDYLQMDHSQFEDDNALSPDEVQDIAPRFHRSKNEEGDDDDEEEEEGDNSGMKSTWGEGWTARKWSARLLDHLSIIYGVGILQYLLPIIEKQLQNPDWEVKESAVLVLGAISRGCLEGLEQYLPSILEVLITMCDDKKPILRSISLWCTGRFSFWIAGRQDVMRVVTATILKHLLDGNKKVQQAACSAFATLEEDAGPELLPYLSEIIETFDTAMRMYQTKNMMVLLDAIGTLAECLGQKIDCPFFYEKICNPLIQMWAAGDSRDPVLIAAFECLTCITIAIPQGISQYAPGIVRRSTDLTRQTLQELDAFMAGTNPERPDRQLIECSLDILSALLETMKSEMEPLLKQTDFLDLLEKCCVMAATIIGSTVKQGAFAIIGDLSEHTPNYIAPKIPVVVPQLIPNIANGPHSVCNNASWAIGQIALYAAHNHELDAYASTICEQLIRVLQAPYFPDSLIRNAGLTMGRLACANPIQVTQTVTIVFGLWCRVLEGVANDSEKIFAFNGLCHVVNHNQQLAVEHMPALLDAICSLYLSSKPQSANAPPPPPPKVPDDVHQILFQIVTWLHTTQVTEWANAMTQIKPSTTQILRSWLAV